MLLLLTSSAAAFMSWTADRHAPRWCPHLAPTPGPASLDETDTDGGGTPWYLRPLRGSGYAFYTFVSSVVMKVFLGYHSPCVSALSK